MFHRQEEIDRLAVLFGIEVEWVTKDGALRIITMTLAPVRDAEGTLTGYVCTSEDVTERVHSHARLTTALDAELEAVDRLRQVDQLKDAFVSSVSHELRTPITSILGYLEILEDGGFGDLSSAQLNALDRASTNSERLLALIDDLLLLSRVQDGGLEARATDCDLGVGIPQHEQAQVFKPFFRSSVTFEMAMQGSGLGLSITQAIAASHHGHVEFESVSGQGSEFRLVFPLRVEDRAPAPVGAG